MYKAVPYLLDTQLFRASTGKFEFSLDKPNVILGPNGVGKSALMKAFSLRFLAYYVGFSAFDDKYTSMRSDDEMWGKKERWSNEPVFMPGLDCETDNAPAFYYHPGMLPGEEPDYTHALMCGYPDLARTQANLVENTSSGQNCRLLLGDMTENPHGDVGKRKKPKDAKDVPTSTIMDALRGNKLPTRYGFQNWSNGRTHREKRDDDYRLSPWTLQSDTLKEMFLDVDGGIPLILLDEPEQSLDAISEMRLWKDICAADTSKVQMIVATHSLYPFMHPEQFNIIEAVPGYMAQVQALLA